MAEIAIGWRFKHHQWLASDRVSLQAYVNLRSNSYGYSPISPANGLLEEVNLLSRKWLC